MARSRPDTTPEVLLRRAFDAYNRRDAGALLTLLHDDVAWSSDGGTLRKSELRAFWTEQWTRTRTHDEVTRVRQTAETEFAVSLDQVVRSVDGSLLSTGSFRYAFVVENGLIKALGAREPQDDPDGRSQ